MTLGYPGGAIGVVETGFLSRDPFTIEMHGSWPAWRTTARRTGSGCVAPERTLAVALVPQDDADAFSRWVSHIRDRTRADDT